MPWVRYDKTGLTTMADAARMVGMSPPRFWRWVREEKQVEAPSRRVGCRHFYTEEQIDKVIQQVARLRKDKRAK